MTITAHYLADLLKMFGGDTRLALAGYNAGEGAVKKYGNQIPPYRETQNYVASITSIYERLSGSTDDLAAAARDLAASTNWRNRDGRPLSDLTEAQQIAIARRIPGFNLRGFDANGGDLSGGVGVFANSRPGNFTDINPEQARAAVEIATRSTGALQQQTGILATETVPRALASVQLVAQEAGDAFGNLPPLVKASGKEMEKEMQGVAQNISGMFGGLLQSVLRGQWKEGLKGLRDDFLSWTVSLAKDWAESKILKALLPKGKGGSAGGGLLDSLIGGIKDLFFGGGKGASAAASSLPTSSIASGALSAAALGGLGAGSAAAFPLSTIAPGLLSGAAFASMGAGGGAAAGAGASAGGGTMLGSLGPFLTNPWTIGIAAAAVGGLLLWRHFRHGTEKELQKAIKQGQGVDVRDMNVLTQIKQIGEQTFGRGQVRKHLYETIKLEPVQQLIDAYAESTGQAHKPQMPHDFLYNSVGGAPPPISVNGSTLMPSPFSGGSRLTTGAGEASGGVGALIEEVRNMARAVIQNGERQAGLVATSNMHVAKAVSMWEPANATDILQRAADTSAGSEIIANSTLRHSASNDGFNDQLARNMRVF